MPLYGVFQAGSNPDLSKNLSDVQPGTSYVLLDGTESIAAETPASVAFARGTQGSNDGGMSFYATGIPSGGSVNIEGANEDIDASYAIVNTIVDDGSGSGAGGTTELGRAAFYRVVPVGADASPATAVKVRVQR
jgi:hypothetical protein